MDDWNKQKDLELEALLSEVKELLDDAPEKAEESGEALPQASLPEQETSAPLMAEDVKIDFEKLYPDEPFPPEDVYTPPTAYEQSKSAYQVARRAAHARVREAEREQRERQREARDREEARVMRRMESQRKTARLPKLQSDEDYARWLYEQGVEPETEEHRALIAAREQAQQETKAPRRARRSRRAFKAILALIVVFALAFGSIHFIVAQAPQAETGLGARKEGCATILLAGTDEGGYRTDTMMLLSVNRAEGRMSLVSIPRDTLIYCEYAVPKINSAYGWASGGEAGMQQLLRRVEEIIGFAPDGYVLVDLSMFENLVDAMGGVSFDVPMNMDYEDPSQDLSIHLSAGEQHLDGAQAMQLVRFRAGYAMQDLGRVETQRAFVSAALRQWAGVSHALRLPKAFRLVKNASQTDLSARELVWLCESAVLCGGEIGSCTLPGQACEIAGGSYYVLDAAGVAQTVNAHCNPYQQAVAVSNLDIRVG